MQMSGSVEDNDDRVEFAIEFTHNQNNGLWRYVAVRVAMAGLSSLCLVTLHLC